MPLCGEAPIPTQQHIVQRSERRLHAYSRTPLDTPAAHPFHSGFMRTPDRHRPDTMTAHAACGHGAGTTTITLSTTTVVRRVVRE